MRKALLIVLLSSFPAWAQQPSPSEEAIGAKLMLEINLGLQCNAALVDDKRKLAAAQARVKELEDKYESKKEPPKK